MKQRLKFFIIYFLYWVLFFLVGRLFFLMYEYPFSFHIGFKEWILTFVYGIRLDISTAGYIMAVAGIILILTSFASGKLINYILKPFTLIVFSICAGIIVSDMELYKNWGYRMDSTPLLYLTKPKEALASTEVWLSVLLLVFTVLLVIAGNYFYNKFLKKQILQIQKAKIWSVPLLILLTGSMILPIRGGVGIAPINTGMVYFSDHKFSNHAAINVVWNVMNSLVYRKNTEKTYGFIDQQIADNIVSKLNPKGEGNTIKVLNTDHPNVFIILLESFSSKVIGAVGGKWDVTPRFDQLAKEGLLFTNFYANGDRSDKGIVAVLSGYPAQPTTSIIKSPSKTQTLPSLFETFNGLGYKSSFYYGGDIDFANMRSYFLNAGAQSIISDANFDRSVVDSKWGAHDEHLFNYIYNDLLNEKSPFFKAAFTLSSHDPFEIPMKPVFEGNDRDTKYLNSVYYTDSCLGLFFDNVKKLDLWKNTLFILVADHGTQRPDNSTNHVIEKFQIPMLWLGGALNDSIKINPNVGSQIDIPATILNQLGIDASGYFYSKDLFNDQVLKYAFYAFNDGFAFVTDSSKVIYDNIGNNILFKEGIVEKDLIKGKAYLQYLMNDYKKR